MSQKKRMCAGQVHNDFGVSFHSCRNGGKHPEAGKWWCGIHLPSRVKARRAERDRKFTAEWEGKQRRWARTERIEKAERALMEGVLARTNVHKGPGLPGWLLDLARAVRKARESC